MLVKQLSSIVRDIAQLTDSYEALRSRTQEEGKQVKQTHKEQQKHQDQLAEDVQQLQLQLRHSVKESNASSMCGPPQPNTLMCRFGQKITVFHVDPRATGTLFLQCEPAWWCSVPLMPGTRPQTAHSVTRSRMPACSAGVADSVVHMSCCRRTTVDELRTTLSEVKQQLSAQQQLSDLRTQQMQERLQQQEEAAKSAEDANAAEHARMQKSLDDCTREARERAEDIQMTLQQDVEVWHDSFGLIFSQSCYW